MFGATTSEQLLRQARIANECGQFHSVFVGDSLLAKPRLESIVLLSAIAAITTRVRLGTACMASFPLRDPVLLASQWASLDYLSGGRTVLVVCTGIVGQAGANAEAATYRVSGADRVKRMIESIALIKRLWTEDDVSFQGDYFACSGVTIGPKPAAQPRPPICIANNAVAHADEQFVRRTLRRVARHADGWQTAGVFALSELAGRLAILREELHALERDVSSFETHLYHNININSNREVALAESKRFLDEYYGPVFSEPMVRNWTASGSPAECAEMLQILGELGFSEITLRITSWDQETQFRKLTEEVLPPPPGDLREVDGAGRVVVRRGCRCHGCYPVADSSTSSKATGGWLTAGDVLNTRPRSHAARLRPSFPIRATRPTGPARPASPARGPARYSGRCIRPRPRRAPRRR
jgi:alkanesulfonate monooxygenase SsuD/methylene tetrahydromethanopterin reductase-like flavin-dependent oxidoreductase (luciferase family)